MECLLSYLSFPLGFGFGVWGSNWLAKSLPRVWVSIFGFKVSGFGFRVSGFVQAGVVVSKRPVVHLVGKGFGFKVQGRSEDLGFRCWGSWV